MNEGPRVARRHRVLPLPSRPPGATCPRSSQQSSNVVYFWQQANATHFRPLPLRGIAPKASKFFWRQSPQDVAGRPPPLGPCTASRPNIIRFESLESPCRIRAPANPSWRFQVVVSMRLELVLSRASPYDRGLYPVRSLHRKPMTRKNSLWWAVRRLREFGERIVHVAHPYRIASTTPALNSLIFSDNRAFRRSYNW